MLKTTLNNADRLRSVGLEAPDFHFNKDDHALIIGAGLAGCATANVLAARGMACTVLEANDTVASATSGVPTAIFRPHLSVVPSIEYRYYHSAFERLITELNHGSVGPDTNGLLQILRTNKPVLDSSHWHPAPPKLLAASNVAATGREYYLPAAGAINPAQLCRHWLNHPRIELRTRTKVESILPSRSLWVAGDSEGNTVGQGNLVVFANALAITNFVDGLTLEPVSGQISHFNSSYSGPVICDRGYLIPTPTGVWAGATFYRGITSPVKSAADDNLNRDFCNQFVHTSAAADQSWSGVRCTTADRLPMIGPLPQIDHINDAYRDLHYGRPRQLFAKAAYQRGLYVFVGLGSRGVVQALHGAECLADSIFGDNKIDESTRLAIHPARFLMKLQRRSPT